MILKAIVMITGIIIAFLIATSLLGEMQEAIDDVSYNVTSATATQLEAISSLFPMMLVLAIGITIITIVMSVMRAFVGCGDDDLPKSPKEEEFVREEQPQEPEKETYEDYVKERIRVEQMMGPFGKFLAWRKGK